MLIHIFYIIHSLVEFNISCTPILFNWFSIMSLSTVKIISVVLIHMLIHSLIPIFGCLCLCLSDLNSTAKGYCKNLLPCYCTVLYFTHLGNNLGTWLFCSSLQSSPWAVGGPYTSCPLRDQISRRYRQDSDRNTWARSRTLSCSRQWGRASPGATLSTRQRFCRQIIKIQRSL